MYNHTRDYLHAHTHTQNRGKDKQNITTKLYISASSIKYIIKYTLVSTGIHHNNLAFSNNFLLMQLMTYS